ncbi:hypothetical protein Ddc_11281 [Ditylenchus destructor]|nr:hypothetical protein Ddc_11281 [Ditylenchus destructor]
MRKRGGHAHLQPGVTGAALADGYSRSLGFSEINSPPLHPRGASLAPARISAGQHIQNSAIGAERQIAPTAPE